VLQQLAAFDVIALFCDWRGVPVAGMYGWKDHSRIGARHRAQASASVPRLKNAWGRIVRAKVLGQATNLRLIGSRDWAHLDSLAKTVRSGDPENVEATAARYYWVRLFADSGFTRTPGGGQGFNGMLDYGYSILRGLSVRSVLAAGLAPALGLFHRGRSNAFNLADDLIEPFRPAIDLTVARLGADMTPTHPSVKAALVAASNQAFLPDGTTLPTALLDLARSLGRYLEADTGHLPVYGWSGPATQDSVELP
jgi:CRISPR-associated protein Cas1